MTRQLMKILAAGVLAFSCTKDKEPNSGTNNKVTLGATAQVSSITNNSAISGGNVLSSGVDEVLERGVCWNTSSRPTIDGGTTRKTVNGRGLGSFTSNLTNLAEGTTYWVRSYAKTEFETIYGSELSFTTVRCPTITTQSATNIQGLSATANGNLTSTGGQSILEKGFCFNTSANPTVNNSKVIVPGGVVGAYTGTLTGLQPNTTYFLRSYVSTSGCNVTYGNEVSFTTLAAPIVTTSAVDPNSITVNSATGGGQVTNNGGAAIKERGLCWNLTGNPTTSDSRIFDQTNALTPFSFTMSSLQFGKTYYVRAYAVNQLNQIGYGQQVTFTTRNITAPTVTASSATNITTNSVTLNGNVTSDGGGTVSQRGVCITALSGFPETCFQATTSGLGAFSFSFTGLQPNTQYRYVFYARNESNQSPLSPSYSAVGTFTTLSVSIPTVSTSPASNISVNSATLCGNVTSAGGGTITERGICWNTTGNPTYLNQTLTAAAGTGAYCVTPNNLLPSTTYFFRAFARNQANPNFNPSYGAETSFRTADMLSPTLSSPSSGSTVRNPSANFSWAAVAGATSYEIQVSRSSTFTGSLNSTTTFDCGGSSNPSTTLVNTRDVTGTAYCMRMTSSTLNATWYWRVRPKNGTITGPWSQTRSFSFLF